MPILVLLFILLPLAELYVLIQVGQAIGALPAIAILLLDAIVGAWLARSQGRLAWRRFNEAMAAGRVPGKEVFDGAMVILGGALLVTPGFITDIFGILLLLPPTRAVLRKLVLRLGARAIPGAPAFMWMSGRAGDARRERAASGEQSRPSREARTPPPPRADPSTPPRRPQPYDIEGTAHEVGGDSEIPSRSEDRDV